MAKDIFIFLLAILLTINGIKWWLSTKGYPYRKYILLSGICWVVAIMAYIFANAFHIGQFFPVMFISFILYMSFAIKAALAERKFRKTSSLTEKKGDTERGV